MHTINVGPHPALPSAPFPSGRRGGITPLSFRLSTLFPLTARGALVSPCVFPLYFSRSAKAKGKPKRKPRSSPPRGWTICGSTDWPTKKCPVLWSLLRLTWLASPRLQVARSLLVGVGDLCTLKCEWQIQVNRILPARRIHLALVSTLLEHVVQGSINGELWCSLSSSDVYLLVFWIQIQSGQRSDAVTHAISVWITCLSHQLQVVTTHAAGTRPHKQSGAAAGVPVMHRHLKKK